MDTDVPIACSLDADELRVRLTEMSEVGRDALHDVRSTPGKAVLRFAADAETRERLEAIVDAEARCCAFLDFSLLEDADEIIVTISAPEGADLVLEDLVSAFGSEALA